MKDLEKMIKTLVEKEINEKIVTKPLETLFTPKTRNLKIQQVLNNDQESNQTKKQKTPISTQIDSQNNRTNDQKSDQIITNNNTKRSKQSLEQTKNYEKTASCSLIPTLKTLPTPFSHLKSKESTDLFQFKNNISEISLSRFNSNPINKTKQKIPIDEIAIYEKIISENCILDSYIKEQEEGKQTSDKRVPNLSDFEDYRGSDNNISVRLETFTDFIEMSEDELENQSVQFSKALPD